MNEIKIDKLVRSRRKTIGLHITNDARLIVRAPYFASEDLIHQLIRRKEAWIKSKLELFKVRQSKIKPRKFQPGEEFLFLGQRYPLTPVEDLPRAVVLDGSLMIAEVALKNARDHLECWYKSQAQEYITQRVEYYSQLTALRYTSININNATTRWGSCGYQSTLNFTWRLIMAPARVIDYVVVHELMHLKQKNHSQKFWKEVANILPDYKLDDHWLKNCGHLLVWSK